MEVWMMYLITSIGMDKEKDKVKSEPSVNLDKGKSKVLSGFTGDTTPLNNRKLFDTRRDHGNPTLNGH